MAIEITFLGTSCAVPTKQRNHSSVHLKYENYNILFDCGEGTQRQMIAAGLSVYKTTHVLLTHLHGDHSLGLAGLLQTMAFQGKKQPLTIIAPKGSKDTIKFLAEWPYFNLPFELKVIEAHKDSIAFENQDFEIHAFPVKHSCPTINFVFQEKTQANLDVRKLEKLGLKNNPLCAELKQKGSIKWKNKTVKLKNVVLPVKPGRKIAYVTDTVYFDELAKPIQKANLLICESTFSENLKTAALEKQHLTTVDAARLALKARVEKLVLTHYSARYDDEKQLEREAKKVFKNTIAARDFTRIQL